MIKKKRRQDHLLIALVVFLGISYAIAEAYKITVKVLDYNRKIEAAALMENAIQVLKEERLRRGIEIESKTDINQTGMIGKEMSEITTTLGSLEAKRTATNPNFAAVILDMMQEIEIKKGDAVAVSFSGSFPALNIAVLSALQILEADPVIISSIGASTWGANIPAFTYLDMENILYQRGILRYKSTAFSIGGDQDIGKNMEAEMLESIVKRIESRGTRWIHQANLERNMEERLEIYFKAEQPIKAFINVGGNMVSMGSEGNSFDGKTGVLLPSIRNRGNGKSLVSAFLNRGIPVIHLLNIQEIAVHYGMPIDPYPMPPLGQGQVYEKQEYPILLIVLSLLVTAIVLWCYHIYMRRSYEW